MIFKEEFLSRLRKIFDLNLYEAKIWTALLSRGTSTAGELSSIGDVPRSRAYDILESLEKRGFILMKIGKPIKFLAIKPKDVIEKAKKNFIEDAEEKAKRLDNLKNEDVLRELNTFFTSGIKYVEPHELSSSIKGRRNINNHINNMVKSASKSITIVTSAEGLSRKVEFLKKALEASSKKGVKIKIAAPINKDNYRIAKDVSKIAEVRNLSGPASRFIITDNKELMFMMTDDKEIHPSYDVGVWLNTEYFSAALHQLFDASWDKMQPLSKITI